MGSKRTRIVLVVALMTIISYIGFYLDRNEKVNAQTVVEVSVGEQIDYIYESDNSNLKFVLESDSSCDVILKSMSSSDNKYIYSLVIYGKQSNSESVNNVVQIKDSVTDDNVDLLFIHIVPETIIVSKCTGEYFDIGINVFSREYNYNNLAFNIAYLEKIPSYNIKSVELLNSPIDDYDGSGVFVYNYNVKLAIYDVGEYDAYIIDENAKIYAKLKFNIGEHDYNETVIKESTCSENGKIEKKCEKCGKVVVEDISKQDHVWSDNFSIDKEPTCIKEGQKSIHCKNCDIINENTIIAIPKSSHVWGNEYIIDKDSTCFEEGQKSIHCIVCGNINENTVLPVEKKGHVWNSEFTIDKIESCKEKGQKSIHCKVCGAINENTIVIIEKNEHTWNAGEVTTVPTCTEVGVKTFTCETCSETKTEEVKAIGHTVVVDNEIDSTCTKTGLTAGSHCSVCNEVLQAQEEIPALGHTWNAGEVTTAPTYTTVGVKTFTCKICGETRTESIPKLSRIDISKATSKVKVSGISAKIYNGKSQTQSALVVTANSKKLKKDTDYSVAYSNNKNIGTATITITGKNGYTGTVRKTFAIKTQVGKVYTTSLKYKVTNARVDGKGTVSVVGSVYKSGDRKFTTLKITDTVTIGGVKFKITKIEKNAFRGYKYLSTVTIGSNVTNFGDTAFYGCGKLTAVTVGKSVKTIGAKSFAGCKNLKRVKLLTTQLTKAGASAFNGIKSNATFALPKKYYNSYSKMIKKAGAPKKAVYKKF